MSGDTLSRRALFGSVASGAAVGMDFQSKKAGFFAFSSDSDVVMSLSPKTIESEAEEILRDHDFMTEVRAGLEDVQDNRLVSFDDVFGEPL